jgi:hypothetical protein
MSNRFTVPAKEVKWLTSCAFSSKKRETRIVVTETVTFQNTFWDGGSKSEYRAVKLESGETAILDGKTVTLEPGFAIVEHSVFCGKEVPLTVYLHPSNVTEKLLAAKK